MAKQLTIPKLLIGTLEQSNDLYYATGFQAPDAVVYLQSGSNRWLIVSALEYGRAKAEARDCNVILNTALDLPKQQRHSVIHWAIALLKQQGIKRVHTAASFSLLHAQRLQRHHIKVEPLSGPLFPQRAVKTRDERMLLRASQQAAVSAMLTAIEYLQGARPDSSGRLERDGRVVTSAEMQDRIEMELLQYRCTSPDTIVAGGAQGANPHERGQGPLFAGEPIVIDIFPRSKTHGYWGDLTRTVIYGEPSPHLKRMYRAVWQSQRAALQKIRPRVHARTIHKTAADVFKQHGFITSLDDTPTGFIHGTGHGVGLDIHEEPRVSTAKGILKRGHIITVEPGLYYPDWGGIRIEDTVEVTADGWRYLCSCPKHFELQRYRNLSS